MADFEEVEHPTRAAATPEGAGGPPKGYATWDAIPKDARFEIDVQGQTVVITGEKLKDMTQMGYRFSDRMREVNERELTMEKTYAPLRKFDEFLTKNPDVKAIVRAAASKKWDEVERLIPRQGRQAARAPVAPGFQPGGEDPNGGQDDFYVSQINGVRDEVRAMLGEFMGTIENRLSEVGGGVQALTAENRETKEISFLKTDRRYAPYATDDNIALAREHQRKFGGDLISAFRNATWESIPARVEESTVERYGIDRDQFQMQGSSPPVVGGMTLDQQTLNDLFDDPDRLAKVEKDIRAHRRRVSGKERYPGLRR